MALEKFNLESLGDLDGGRVAAAFEQALKRCRMDCEDRPGVRAPRKINVVLTIEPNMTEKGDLQSVQVDAQISETLPKRQSASCQMAVDGEAIYFNDLSPDNPKQGTLDDQGGFIEGRGPKPTTQNPRKENVS